MDFYQIKQVNNKNKIEIYPDFVFGPSKDLMVRGKSFYAIWNKHTNLWSTNEFDVQKLIDEELAEYVEQTGIDKSLIVTKVLKSFSTKSWLNYRNYINNSPDNAKPLDSKITFSNTEVKKSDYVSKRLPYPLAKCDIPCFEEIMSTLYDPDERVKLEWAIGAIISGDSKSIQKFIVLYGPAGAGKSTILNIIEKLFPGYCCTFEAKALTSNASNFSTESFRTNPLVAIQHDGDLSNIKDNTLLNSIVSHETIIVNEKHKATYPLKVNSFLFMGTNKPVKITDAKSGIIRRLIDVHPSGRKLETKRYNELINGIDFELSGIAYHCLEIYKEMGKNYYSTYKPVDMMYKTDPFFNFVEDSFEIFDREDCTTLKGAYSLYKDYCANSGDPYVLQMYKFREELKNYFKEFYDRKKVDGQICRSFYSGFIRSKFSRDVKPESEESDDILELNYTESIFDKLYSDIPAQYAVTNKTGTEIPGKKWEQVTTKLSDLDTSQLHYAKVPEENHIVMDFDLKDEDGNKSFELNAKAASKFPKTYAETSKSGEGIHLHYIYDGDVSELSRVYDEGIEVKIFTGNSSLRRKLTKCNNEPIAHISSGLPLKAKGDKMINHEVIKSEKSLRNLIIRNINKEIHPGTKPSIDFIYKILEDAYKSELKYDISDMYQDLHLFACSSSHHADYCKKLVDEMKLKSAEEIESEPSNEQYESDDLVFFDTEVFPNLFVLNWKIRGPEKTVVRMINPSPAEVEALTRMKLVGFNCRKYDNHIIYARMCGYSNEQLYNLSKRIISGDKTAFFPNAYNLSYTDIYDFSAKKQSLKKFEIELGIHHLELGLDWNEPVPEKLWNKVAEYCDNDVLATEATFEARYADFEARCVLADIAGGIPNDTTNTLTTRLIFGSNRAPQTDFEYYNMANVPNDCIKPNIYVDADNNVLKDDYTVFDKFGRAFFPGYLFERGKSIYRDEEIGEGGYVWAKPGIHTNVKTFDITSMHPHSVKALNLFGDYYTERFYDLVKARIAVKHKDYKTLETIFNGAFKGFINADDNLLSNLSTALKIAINSVYGLTAAKFENPFRDPRNKDNIVAKRGALFMVNLRHLVQELGGDVIHIKTDSIKVANPSPEVEKFIYEYGRMYGYEFEIESEYEKIFLANNAVYVAYEKGKGWTATGTQFQIPYVFKTLFSKEPIQFEDLCVTNSVSTAIYLDLNENYPDVTAEEKELSKLESKYRKGELSDMMFDELREPLIETIKTGHNYKFIGKVGCFCPMLDGCNAGLLVREHNGKYPYVGGSKGYRWMESEIVLSLHLEDRIDHGYFIAMVDEALESISRFGDAEQFLS